MHPTLPSAALLLLSAGLSLGMPSALPGAADDGPEPVPTFQGTSYGVDRSTLVWLLAAAALLLAGLLVLLVLRSRRRTS